MVITDIRTDGPFVRRITNLKLRHFVLLSVISAEVFTSFMSLLLKGRVTPDYLITGGVVSLVVASVMSYFIRLSSRLMFEKEYLQKEVAERTRAEEEIRRSEGKYRALFETASDAIFVHDFDGNVMEMNEKGAEIFGYPKPEIHSVKLFGLLLPQFHETARRALAEAMLRGHAHFEADFRRKAGGTFPAEVSLSLLDVECRKAVLNIVHDLTERKQAEGQVRASLAEKETLLREIHHRVKNNMQIILSLIRLQKRKAGDERYESMLEDTRNRIQAMALVHEQIYGSRELSKVDFGGYIRRLASSIFSSYAVGRKRITLRMELEEVSLNIDTAILCGMILNELISNALKHAFSGRPSGEVRISLQRKADGWVLLRVGDNGCGMPPGAGIEGGTALGLLLVNTLVEQIGGKLTVNVSEGTEFGVSFRG